MTISVNPRIISDLKWWADGEYAGAMGQRSAQGRIEETLQRGGFIQSSSVNYGVSPSALAAATRLRHIATKLNVLTPHQIDVIRLAFKTSDKRGDIRLYGGDYARVALVSPVGRAAYQEDVPGGSGAHYEAWLLSLTYSAQHAKSLPQRMEYLSLVAKIRSDVENLVADAIRAYGGTAKVTRNETPDILSLNDLVRRLHSDPRTIRRDLSRRGIKVVGKGVPLLALREQWPEAFAKMKVAA